MSETLELQTNRRRFLRGAVGVGTGLVALGAGCLERKPQEAEPTQPAPDEGPTPPTGAPRDALPDGLDPSKFHLYTRQPLTLETKRSSFGVSPITPTSIFFVRNNLPMPDASIVANADSWQLEVAGVKEPRRLSLTALKQLATETITSVVQCSGNGRKFYEHGASGSQWATGAAGCAMWTGVRVKDVVEMLGGTIDGVKFMTSTGGEELPAGVDPLTVVVERSLPIDKGLQDCMLVWEMNGLPIPITHGGPLRLIVPGYYGCNQIKYIKRLAFTVEQTQAKIQKSGYRYRPIGEKGNPSHPSMWRMNVKSWVNGPGADGEPVLKGKVHFYGVALSGERGVTKVEASMDGGKSWELVRFVGPDLGKSAWRAFVYEAELAPGQHTIATRATDDAGDTQPDQRDENERGYGNNGWKDHALTVTVVDKLPEKKAVAAATSPPAGGKVNAKDSATLSAEGKQGKAILAGEVEPACGACHALGDAGLSGTVGPNLDALRPTAERVEAAITNGVGVMPPYKGTLTDEKIKLVARYIAEATK